MMWQSTTLALSFAASLFAIGELAAAPIDRALFAVAAVGLGSATAALSYGRASFFPISVGALSPLLFVLVSRHSLVLGVTIMCFSWIAPRMVLAETRERVLLVATMSLAEACVAGLVFASYVDAPWSAHVAACIFAGSCLSLGSLVGVRTSVAFALLSAAAVTDAHAREALERAARAHRSFRRPSKVKTWRTLIHLADQRAALTRSMNTHDETCHDLDERIAALVEELAPSPIPPSPEAVTPMPAKSTSDATS